MSELDKTSNYDAEQMVEEIASGDEKSPKVNVEADYERSKSYSVSEIDRTGKGAEAAEQVTSHDIEASNHTEIKSDTIEEGGDPEAYRSLAKDANPRL